LDALIIKPGVYDYHHQNADKLLVAYLRDLGHNKAANAYNRAKKRCAFSYDF